MFDRVRRLRPTVELLFALKKTRPSNDAPPDRDELLKVQKLAHTAGGLAAMVSELMACYTASGRSAQDPLVLCGRSVSHRGVGLAPEGWNCTYPGAAVDASLARIAVPMATGSRARAITAITVLDHLRSDVGRQRTLGSNECRTLARALELCAPDLARSLVPGGGGALISSSDAPFEAMMSSAVELVTTHGLVHARIGAAAHWSGELLYVSHWETLRRVSPGVRELIRTMIDPCRSWKDEMRTAAVALDTDAGLLRDLMPVAIEAMEPLVGLVATPTQTPVPPRELPVTEVPDDLGLIYGVACLIGVCRLVDAAGDRSSE